VRIYTRSGDLAFKTFTFPDGQPHFKLETYGREFDSVNIEVALKSPNELFTLILANSVLRECGYSEVNLDIRYLLAARMDREIDSLQPFTLRVVSGMLNNCGFSKVRILDVHSEVATRLIRNSENVLPIETVRQALITLGYPTVVCPDKGAYDRVSKITHEVGSWTPFIQCGKKRDPNTGALSGFEILDYKSMDQPYSDNLLIIDDICDGGGTFVGLASELRAHGAKKVFLYVTHNVQSKQLLDGIDGIYTTDSYTSTRSMVMDGHGRNYVVIPISMKDLK